jgi:hypothetical protein
MAESAAEFVAALQQIVKLPLSDCVPTNRYIYFVLRNRAELHENFQITLVRPRHLMSCTVDDLQWPNGGPCLKSTG